MYSFSRILILLYLFIQIFITQTFAQNYKIIESNSDYIIIEFNYTGSYSVEDTIISGKKFQWIRSDDNYNLEPGDPWLPLINYNIGIPHNSSPTYTIIQSERVTLSNKFIIPFPETDPNFEEVDVEKINKNIYSANQLFPKEVVKLNNPYIYRYAKILPVSVSPYQFNPVSRELVFNRKVLLRINFNVSGNDQGQKLTDNMTENFLESAVLNVKQAVNWISNPISKDNSTQTNGYWYDPNKNYFKIYLKEKGVYRVTYSELVSAGVPLGSNTPINKIELFNLGESVPIDIVDSNTDQVFNSGDYFQFVGFSPPSSPNSYFNIYNLSNVYWFSYESDSTGQLYNNVNGFPQNWNKTFQSTRHTIHSEKDSIFERLGYCSTGEVDYWFWGKATAQNSRAVFGFEDRFPEFPNKTQDSNYVTLRVKMHGITDSRYCNTDHKAEIDITNQLIGYVIWDGQEPILFEKQFYVSADSIRIFPTGNRLNVWVRGDICSLVHSDEIRVNWYEFEYWRNLKTNPNNFIFKSPEAGNIRYWTTRWMRNNMKIYIPERNKMITNPNITNDQYNSVLFVDTANIGTEYFCVADDYFLPVDSIEADQPSNLRDISNGADYIIITHPNFLSAAQNLADYRTSNFPDPDINNVRVKLVDVMQIYDEFAAGLLDPNALKDFIKYAFDNWQSPAPSYVALLGDMSYDYRKLLTNGRPNFIPSIPLFAAGYGQAASDNMMVAVSGNDVVPDLAIGRISCETLGEANILINKIINYPEDETKPWKENTIFLASGLDEDDENQFQFNDYSLYLGNTYVRPFGYNATYVFRYPTKPQHIQYQGGGPRMREEIDKGAVLINYYGHGGGSQWDLVFTDDDIDLLNNEGRLPVILSLTCYTAHFDNQRIFGEHFNLVPNGGSVGFLGSSGLTYWTVATTFNLKIFNEIFTKRNTIIGKVILNAKNQIQSGGLWGTQIALLTYLGDPALQIALPKFPDFVVNAADITILPENPIVGDTISVKVNINNLGRIFPGDSALVELYASSADTSYIIGSTRISSFGDKDSVSFTWTPKKGNLFELTAKVNEDYNVEEPDHSDNIASQFFIVFNISEPNVLIPVDGFSTNKSSINFAFSDIGYYVKRDLSYTIEIDTSLTFDNPLFSSPSLSSSEPIIEWQSPNLSSGIYFWRARIFDGVEYGNWSPKRSFTVSDTAYSGYFAWGKILQTFKSYNMIYSDSSKSLRLNTELLPARPSNVTFTGDINLSPPLPPSQNLTAITTDGTFLYYGSISFFVNNGPSPIYKVGTGYNGTVRGQVYGQLSSFNDKIYNSIVYHSDGYIYVPTGKAHQLTRINVSTEEIDTVSVPPGMLRWENSIVSDGPVLLSSDGVYVYNLTQKDEQGNFKYTLRTFNPANGWELARPDIVLSGTSYVGLSGFFVFGNYIYPAESFYSNYMRRIRLNDGFFEEEWITRLPFQSYYSWCADWQNNRIYSSVYRASGFVPKFSEFVGNYIDANGSVTSNPIGPVSKWNDLSYDLYNPSSTGEYSASLLGLNSVTKLWDTLAVNIPAEYSLSDIQVTDYPKLKLNFTLTDSSLGSTDPMELKSAHVNYQQLPDVYFVRNDLTFAPDSILQGFPITMKFKARNFGPTRIDSLNVGFYLNGEDSVIYSKVVNVPADSSSQDISYTIETDHLLFENEMRAYGQLHEPEYFRFDNLIENKFYVARDSVRPLFSITFDDQEIISGDIISAKPDVKILLTDNSPLSLDTSFFTIVFDDTLLHFTRPDIQYSINQYPDSKLETHWKPVLPDGKHTLQVLAKDASGNFFDTTSYRIDFSVYNETDVTEVYNYPNPFKQETYFTFSLRGTEIPEKFQIKVYTIAGRLIRDMEIPSNDLIIGFNKFYWDGRDQDGDEIGNGVYLYKLIAKFSDKTKAVTQKLARVR